MAKWWALDPDLVGRWTMRDFEDREEYMFVQDELSQPRDKNAVQPGETEWAGR